MERTALGVEAEMKSAVAEGDYARAGEIGSAAGLSPDLIPVVIGNLLIELRQQEKALSFLSGSQLMREAEAEIQAEGEPASSPLEEPSLEEPSNVDDPWRLEQQ